MPYEIIFLDGEKEVVSEERGALNYIDRMGESGITHFDEKYITKRLEANAPLIITKSLVDSKIEKIIPLTNIRLFRNVD